MKRIAVKYGERIYINGRALKVARSKRAGVVNLYVDEDCPVASDAGDGAAHVHGTEEGDEGEPGDDETLGDRLPFTPRPRG